MQATMRLVLLAVAHFAAGMLCLFWASAFRQALEAPNASVTGPWAYCALGLVHIAIGASSAVQAYFEDNAGRTLAEREGA